MLKSCKVSPIGIGVLAKQGVTVAIYLMVEMQA